MGTNFLQTVGAIINRPKKQGLDVVQIIFILQSEAPHQSPSGDSFPRFTKKKAIAKRIGEALWDNVSFAFPKERCYGNEQIILGEGGGVADG